MRILPTFIILSTLLYSCNSKREENNTISRQNDESIPDASIVIEEPKYPYSLNSLWAYDCMKDTVLQIHNVDKDTLSLELLVSLINRDFKHKVYCEFVEVQNDTAFVRIPNSEYLTQSMGTTGAYEYMIATTFTLTELEGIKYVNFDFEFGDHAMPGTYSRKYYLDEIENNKRLNNNAS